MEICNKKTHHHLGHGFFISGLFVALIGLTIMAPMNVMVSKAFGVSDIIELSNQAREQFGVNKLTTNTSLMNAAQTKAEDMARLQYFAHSAPDGTVAWDYYKKAGYIYSIAGENLAITNEDDKAVIDGWLNSPTHRDNLLNNQYTDFGIGMASYGNYKGHSNTYVIVAFYGHTAPSQSLVATTVPAGTSATLKPQFLSTSPAIIGSIAAVLMVAGVFLEFKHLKHLHKIPHFA
jgi:hypothetical protein